MKRCYKCGETKSVEENFYKNRTRHDGYCSACKQCSSEIDRVYRKEYRKRPHVKKKRSRDALIHQRQHPEKKKAHDAVHTALKNGKLIRLRICQAIGCSEKENIEAHHDNYSKRLNVRWFCRECHNAFHGRAA